MYCNIRIYRKPLPLSKPHLTLVGFRARKVGSQSYHAMRTLSCEVKKKSYHSLHHVHSSFSHCRNFSKNIDRTDDTFFKFLKNCINSKEDTSSANTSAAKVNAHKVVHKYTQNAIIHYHNYNLLVFQEE